ncbi:MAG: (2Fe-2S)-binding protein [Candidatus Sulfotelmatobacter sp.]
MPETITLTVNGAPLAVPIGTTVAVAMVLAGHACRISASGERRGPLCGMGTCFECRVAVNGRSHCRGCQMLCESGMEVNTNE